MIAINKQQTRGNEEKSKAKTLAKETKKVTAKDGAKSANKRSFVSNPSQSMVNLRNKQIKQYSASDNMNDTAGVMN